MTSSKSGFGKRRAPLRKNLAIAFLAVSALGFADATYLTVKHYQGSLPTCNFLRGCNTVLTSQYATVGPVPISLAGSLYYLAIFLLVFGYIDSGRVLLLRLAAYLTWTGFLVSLWLLYLQVAVLRSLCEFCIFSGVTATLLFVLGVMALQKSQSAPEAAEIAEGR